jgi:hypothetical protein
MEMLVSFEQTKSPGTEIAIYLSEDDPWLAEYKKFVDQYTHIIGPRRYQAEVFNMFPALYPGVKFYGAINDDHVYLTKGWDRIFMEAIEIQGRGWGMACGNDLLTDWKRFQYPSAEIISGNIIRTLGYYVWPEFRHIGIDFANGLLFSTLKKLFHFPDIIIEHRHVSNNKAAQDDNYKWIYGPEEQEYGHGKEAEYTAKILPRYIKLIQEAIAKEG